MAHVKNVLNSKSKNQMQFKSVISQFVLRMRYYLKLMKMVYQNAVSAMTIKFLIQMGSRVNLGNV